MFYVLKMRFLPTSSELGNGWRNFAVQYAFHFGADFSHCSARFKWWLCLHMIWLWCLSHHWLVGAAYKGEGRGAFFPFKWPDALLVIGWICVLAMVGIDIFKNEILSFLWRLWENFINGGLGVQCMLSCFTSSYACPTTLILEIHVEVPQRESTAPRG